jgi:hypothetical protein
MPRATSTKQVTSALRRAGYAVDCVKGSGYVYFMADDMREIDSVYVCYLRELTVERYVEHVAAFFA